MMVHAFSLSTWETQISVSLRPASLVYNVNSRTVSAITQRNFVLNPNPTPTKGKPKKTGNVVSNFVY